MGKTRGGKTKIIKKTLGGNGDEINALFSQLLGNEDSLDPIVITDKYIKLKQEVKTINELLNRFNITILEKLIKNNSSLEGNKKDIEFFINNSNKEFELSSFTMKEIVPKYLKIKQSNTINNILILCKNLIQYKSYISDKDKLSDRFIYNEPGDELLLFPFTDLNFKFLFRHPDFNTEENKKLKPYTMLTLCLLYKVSYSIYEIVTSPDINIQQFSEVIIQSISEAKKSIPRCEKAFNKISNSLDMLTGNFNNYYKDFIQTKQPSIILENFLLDISKDTSDSDFECVSQLKTIVEFYKKKTMTSGAIKDPRINQLFETIQDKFNMMDVVEEKANESEENVEEIEV
jgi:hypothetical protein